MVTLDELEKYKNIDSTMWACENCNNSNDLIWIIEDIIDTCKVNQKYKESLFSSKGSFSHTECDTCYHSIFFYDEALEELKKLVKEKLK